MTTVLITGAAGFAGSHIAEWIIQHTDWNVVAMDCLTYAGHLEALAHLPKNRVEVLHHDFTKPLPLVGVDYIIHNGAQSHVMRSLARPQDFVEANILGTYNVLEMARIVTVRKFIYVSTDEVFGPSVEGISYTENFPHAPSNPYSATKAAGELVARAFFHTQKVPVVVTRTMNMFGERQHPEKFVPMTIRKVLNHEWVDIHCNEKGRPNMRQWSHASIQASAQLFLLEYGVPGEAYHVAGMEMTNLEVAQRIGLALYETVAVHTVDISKQFPGHDHGYSLCDKKLRAMGWVPPTDTLAALESTAKWFAANPKWLED